MSELITFHLTKELAAKLRKLGVNTSTIFNKNKGIVNLTTRQHDLAINSREHLVSVPKKFRVTASEEIAWLANRRWQPRAIRNLLNPYKTAPVRKTTSKVAPVRSVVRKTKLLNGFGKIKSFRRR